MDTSIVIGIMFWLGIIQLVWAVLHEHFTRIPLVKKHFEYYFMGVLSLFATFCSGGAFLRWSEEFQVLMVYLFVGSAFVLAGYHFFIVAMSIWLGWFKKVM